ncbi:MAG TPA: TatD family hydrolase [Caldisericia bacterium]|nr:TatD family hydrolase [Caldisericia bacterium]
MEIIDTHAHLDLPDFKGEFERVLKRAKEGDVCQIINVGFDLESSSRSVSLAQNNREIFATVGIHPHEAKKWGSEIRSWIIELSGREKVVAIGEIGLDYYRDLSYRQTQREVFSEQIEIAKNLGKPVVIHSRDAQGDVMRMLEEHSPKSVVLHCFSGDTLMAEWAFERGYHLSFGGPLTYPRNERLEMAATIAPEDLIMVETDCPYLSPVPLRGKRNEPSYIRHTLIRLANIRKCSVEKMAEITTANARRFFSITNP